MMGILSEGMMLLAEGDNETRLCQLIPDKKAINGTQVR